MGEYEVIPTFVASTASYFAPGSVMTWVGFVFRIAFNSEYSTAVSAGAEDWKPLARRSSSADWYLLLGVQTEVEVTNGCYARCFDAKGHPARMEQCGTWLDVVGVDVHRSADLMVPRSRSSVSSAAQAVASRSVVDTTRRENCCELARSAEWFRIVHILLGC